jgi:hypothetical protein
MLPFNVVWPMSLSRARRFFLLLRVVLGHFFGFFPSVPIVNQERRRRKECSFHGCIKGSALVPGFFSAKFRFKKRVSLSMVGP